MKHLRTQVLEIALPGWGFIRHLKVWREDEKSGISWDELQEVKDFVLGPEVMAIEIYPPRSEIVDEVNMRHLWEVPPGVPLPNLSRR